MCASPRRVVTATIGRSGASKQRALICPLLSGGLRVGRPGVDHAPLEILAGPRSQCLIPSPTVRASEGTDGIGMVTSQRYFDRLDALLAAMPPGQLDVSQIEANEQRHRHRFFDPPETVHRWLLDQQRRVQASHSAR
jgi:hypothetical protein